MIQRITLLNGIKAENEAIQYYTNLVKLADTEEDRKDFNHVLKEEKEHKVILVKKLKKYTDKKGQTHITNLLSI
jgi:rubrerythrin